MCSSSRSLPNNGRPLQALQVVSKFLRAGKRTLGSEHVDRLLRQSGSGNIGQRPILLREVLLAVVKIVQMGGLIEQVTGDHRDHLRIAPAILAKIEDDRVYVR